MREKKSYPPELRQEVAEYYSKNGRSAAAEKWPEIPPNTMYTWFFRLKEEGQSEGVYDRGHYDDAFKKQVIAYYKSKGIAATKEKFGLNNSTIYAWVRKEEDSKTTASDKNKKETKKEPKKKAETHTYSKVEIPDKPSPKNKKIYVVYSEDADAIVDVLKGLK